MLAERQSGPCPPSTYVPTPIGNLEDITLRALRVLGEVDLIAAEDTRVTRKLLARYEIQTPLTPFHEHNLSQKLPDLLDRLATEDIALVSDAGTPTINDPGQELVVGASEMGFAVVPLPGASAVTTALAASGLPTRGFVFLGFLPRRRTERIELLSDLRGEQRTLVAFETPHRLTDSLSDLLETLGDRQIAVCRELTKLHEEVFRGSVSDAIHHFIEPRGEFTLVIEGNPEQAETVPDAEVTSLLLQAKNRGMSARDAVSLVSEATGRSQNATSTPSGSPSTSREHHTA